ncbi:hypothetical protein LTR85_012131 [Meristemomyces frigidus]|nr:hypothetical protein LTR85_012131 [Meristemomyces frigidus]
MTRKRHGRPRASPPPPPLAPSATADQTPSRLLDLPNELLLPILELAVTCSTKEQPIKIDRAVKSKKSSTTSPLGVIRYRKGAELLLQPAITRVCRFLREEGLPMFYKKNVFYSHNNRHSFRAARRWLDGIGQVNMTRVTELYIDITVGGGSLICACRLAVTLEQAVSAWSRDGNTLSVHVSSGKPILDRVTGAPAVRVRLEALDESEDVKEWVDAGAWASEFNGDCIDLSEKTLVRQQQESV